MTQLTRLRTRWTLLIRLLRLRWAFATSWVILAISVPIPGATGQVLAYVGIALGLCFAAIDSWHFRSELGDLRIEASTDWKRVKPGESEARIVDQPFFVVDPPSGGWASVEVTIGRRPWELGSNAPSRTQAYRIHRQRIADSSDLTNDKKVRICSAPSGRVLLRQTDYLMGVVTNEFANSRLMSKGRCVYNPWDLMASGGKLLPLSESEASNHLGVSMLIETSDRYLILQQASKSSNVGSGKLGPSISGSMDWEDARESDGQALLKVGERAVRREFREETSLSADKWLLDPLRFAGLGRILPRGGKPELVYCAKSHRPMAQWQEALEDAPERETEHFHFRHIGSTPVAGTVAQQGLAWSYSLALAAYVCGYSLEDARSG